MSTVLDLALDPERFAQVVAADEADRAADAAMFAMRKPPASKPLGLFGTVLQHRMPCPSDADPGADALDDDEAGMLACIDEAEQLLAQARELIESRKAGGTLAAQSRMTQAAGWLQAA